MSRIKPVEVRFYTDADLLGLARVLAGLRSDATYPGDPGTVIHKRQRPPCPIASPAVKDSEWIPQVAGRGWLIITRDRHIQEHRLEIAAVREHGARMVALTAADAGSVFRPIGGRDESLARYRALPRRAAALHLRSHADHDETDPAGLTRSCADRVVLATDHELSVMDLFGRTS